jgi:aminopeptidase C
LPNFTDQQLPQLNKGDKLLHRIITPNHAMLIRGYNLRTQGIDKWLVENSHGENKEVGKERDKNNQANGYFTMTTGWFRENVVQVVVPKRVLSPSLFNKYKKASIQKLPPWGSMSCQLLD